MKKRVKSLGSDNNYSLFNSQMQYLQYYCCFSSEHYSIIIATIIIIITWLA